MQAIDGLPDAYDLRAEPIWGLERYPWGASRFIYEVKIRTTDTGEEQPVAPDESKRVTDNPYELRRVREHIVGDIVRALSSYRSLGGHLEHLGIRW